MIDTLTNYTVPDTYLVLTQTKGHYPRGRVTEKYTSKNISGGIVKSLDIDD